MLYQDGTELCLFIVSLWVGLLQIAEGEGKEKGGRLEDRREHEGISSRAVGVVNGT